MHDAIDILDFPGCILIDETYLLDMWIGIVFFYPYEANHYMYGGN